MFYFIILLLFISQNVNSLIATKGLKFCRYGCLKNTPIIEDAIQQMVIKTIATPKMGKIEMDPAEKQIWQKINSETKQNVWRRKIDFPGNLLGRSQLKPINMAQISEMGKYCLPTGICPKGDVVKMMTDEKENSLASDADDKNNNNNEEGTKKRQESMIENFRRKIAETRIQKFISNSINTLKGGKIIQKIFDDKRKKQFAKKLIELNERKKTIQKLCHPNSIRNLGSSSKGPKAETDEKNNKGTEPMEKMEGKKEGGQIGAKNDGTDSEKVTMGISYKSAIRFALRVYFCNYINKKDNNDDNGWKSIGQFGLKEWIEHMENVPVKRVERWFKRSDPIYPHEYKADFKFTLFFPDEFAELWTKFGLKAEDLLISLTDKNLDGFENPAKSGSWMVTSWDKQIFLKSVKMVQKNAFDDILEKDFFFNMQKDGRNIRYWSEEEYKKNKEYYKGGFAYYFQYMMGIGNNEEIGKKDELSMTTLLPKYYGLFVFQEKDQSSPQLITIQNGIFPNVLPYINYKFDLKGSSNNRLLSNAKADEKIAKKEELIWMDLNFIEHKQNNPHGFFRNGIQISAENWQKIRNALDSDSKFLSSHNIVDYSLLLGLHFVEKENGNGNGASNAEKEKLKYGIPAHCTNCSDRVKMPKQKSQLDEKIEESGYLSDSDNESIHEDVDWENRREIRIYIGIIDIFQAYNGAKWVESKWKSFGSFGKRWSGKEQPSVFPQNYDSNKEKKKLIEHSSITIIESQKYQQRFMDFLTMVVFRKENI